MRGPRPSFPKEAGLGRAQTKERKVAEGYGTVLRKYTVFLSNRGGVPGPTTLVSTTFESVFMYLGLLQ